MVKGFSKMYILSFFGHFICKHFYSKTRFCKFANFLADSKSKASELSNNVSLVIFGHQISVLEGGGAS